MIQRHSGESSFIAPSGAATQTTWAPPWTSERYRSSLRLISAAAASAASVAQPGHVEHDQADAEHLPGRVVHREPGGAAAHVLGRGTAAVSGLPGGR